MSWSGEMSEKRIKALREQYGIIESSDEGFIKILHMCPTDDETFFLRNNLVKAEPGIIIDINNTALAVEVDDMERIIVSNFKKPVLIIYGLFSYKKKLYNMTIMAMASVVINIVFIIFIGTQKNN